jgi:hypothetical protein
MIIGGSGDVARAPERREAATFLDFAQSHKATKERAIPSSWLRVFVREILGSR